jgi:hypothetical protein
MKSGEAQADESASQRIDAQMAELDDWRGETLSRLRGLIKEADEAFKALIRAAVSLNITRLVS